MSTALGIQAVSGENFSYSWSRIAEDRHFGVADDRGPLLLAALRRRAASAARACAAGIELHPDGQLFFVQNLAGHQQQALQAIAQQRLPKPANERKLIAKRARASRTAGARKSSSRLTGFASGKRNQRARGEVSGNCAVTWR